MLCGIWRVGVGILVAGAVAQAGLARVGLAQAGLARSTGSVVMVRAELVKALDTTKVKTGDVFYLKTTEDWQRPDCTVHSQAKVLAQVTRLDRPGKGTELAMRFQAMPCAGSERRMMTPLLVALGSKPMEAPLGLQRLMGAGAEDAALSALFNPPPPASLKIAQQPINKFETAPVYSFGGKGLEDEFRTGDVKGFRNVKMQLPQGTPDTTLVAAKNLYLNSGTIFMLTMVVTAPGGEQPGGRRVLTAVAANKAEAGPGATAVKAVEPVEVCAAGGCVEAVEGGSGMSGAVSAMWSRPLKGLGFLPRLNRVVLGQGPGLDDDAAVEFLGEDEVLLAFNTHRLVRRTAAEAAEGRSPRQVRALVFSRTDGQLLKAEDWAVESGVGPFLWSLGDGRVLAHVGEELLELGAGLEVQHRILLPGPVLFLSTATGAGPMLVATVKERHQPGEHATMNGFLRKGEVINEDYELTAIDGSLRVIRSQEVAVVPLRPALLADAAVSARADKSGVRYTVEEQRWTGEQKRLASVASGCEVQVNTLATKTLYVSGCDATNGLRGWYRLLTPAGTTLLKGRAGPTDLLQQALSDEDGSRFVTVSSHFDANTFASANITEAEFKRLTVSVFDTKTGKEMFRATPEMGGSAMRQAVALSGSGNWVAVLAGSTLEMYGVRP